jgi:hypothetical protein
MNTDRWFGSPVFPSALALGVAIVAAAALLGNAAMGIANSRSLLTVTGSAKRTIRSDYIVWRANVSATSPDVQSAYAKLKADAEAVRRYLVGKGIPADSLVFSSINTLTMYERTVRGDETGRISAYRLFQTVEVRSSDVDRVAQVAREATELIHQGVAIESQPPEFLYTRIAEVKVAILADATRDAKQRAEEIASNAGSRIGRIRTARMGVFQITPQYSTMITDYGIYDTSSLMKDVTAVVSMSFEVR